MPSRLLSAFPPGVPIRRVPLDEAILLVSADNGADGLGLDARIVHQGRTSGPADLETE
jgi:ATP-dependent DNA helicase DinG